MQCILFKIFLFFMSVMGWNNYLDAAKSVLGNAKQSPVGVFGNAIDQVGKGFVEVLKERLKKQQKTLQPPVVTVLQGEVEKASLNGQDITEDFKKFVAYYVDMGKRYPGQRTNNLFEGDPLMKTTKYMNVIYMFADGSYKRGWHSENKVGGRLGYSHMPVQVVDAQHGRPLKQREVKDGKEISPIVAMSFDVTWYFQQATYSCIDLNMINRINNPSERSRLNQLWRRFGNETLEVYRSGMPVWKGQGKQIRELENGWEIKTTACAPGMKRLQPSKPAHTWKAQDWFGRNTTRAYEYAWWGTGDDFVKQEQEELSKLPKTLQVVAGEDANTSETQSRFSSIKR